MQDMAQEEVYAGSPIAALHDALEGGVQPGRVGVVIAGPGLGKSALLVHIALDSLLRGHQVLHVALRDTVHHARAHYDEVFRAVSATSRARDWSSVAIGAERHRMIHSYIDRPFDTAHLAANLEMLAGAAEFRPKLLVVDGLNAASAAETIEPLAAVAEKIGAACWMSISSKEPTSPEVWAHAVRALRLTGDGRSVRLSLAKAPRAAEDLSIHLDPTSMLVLGDTGEAQIPPPIRSAECTLYSGGARGAETAFGVQAERHGVHEVTFSFDGHRQDRTRGRYALSPRELAAGDVSLVYVSKRLNRTYKGEGGLIRKVLQTLWHMVSRSQQVFVVGAIQPDGTVHGGTGWSVELARMWNKDLWVFDQTREGWFRWDGREWVPGTPRITTVHFTGTGTRYLKENGAHAIEELFERSFG